MRAPADDTPLVTTEVLGVLDAILPRQSERTRAHRGIALRFAFCYSVGHAPLTLPVAHVQSKLAAIFTSERK